ncbi:Mpo1-like protein [Hylemonella gracilis]|uniref:Terminase n=1 Tax=Hylemonella gracilis ATCC 19624 TaxID=887062 RepID=F3KU05_9BURK|nr:Mpo1-like protein [Hylemonella gracilis]EGI76757.1 hypothetical protein HGR_09685 [Hylemonella gracilis ATCC 19624]
MTPAELLRWQWQDYSKYHASRLNLLIHIVAVPAFLAGNVLLILAVLTAQWPLGLGALVGSLLAFGVQGIGHGKEAQPSVPFSSLSNALGRILLEQWVTFPRYVLSGGWRQALRRAS